MERVRPLCRNASEVHGPHGFWSRGYTVWNECEGWTQAQAGATALMDVLDGYARDHWLVPMDDGIRLECHPSVTYALQQMVIPGYEEFVAGVLTGKTSFAEIPVVACPSMEPGAWRLVHGDPQIVAQGAISETASSSATPGPGE